MSSDRPIGVAILAVLILLYSVFLVIIGFLSFTIIFLFGVVGFFVALGLLQLKEWAWWSSLMIFGLNLIFAIIWFDVLSIIISIVIVIYLIAVARSFYSGSQAPKYSEQWICDPPKTKEDLIDSVFGRDAVETEYSKYKSDYICPKCKSEKVRLMKDGSGYCDNCNKPFGKALKKSVQKDEERVETAP